MRNVARSILFAPLLLAVMQISPARSRAAELKVGIATRDITPDGPIWLSGYAARDRASERVDHRLEATALCFEDSGGERFVLVAIDNCELGPDFAARLQERIASELALEEGTVIIVPSHTHSGPVLDDVLDVMFHFEGKEKERVVAYSEKLRKAIIDVIRLALKEGKPAKLQYGVGKASFAMNRRIYREDHMAFGENPEGPADRDVPVLRITTPDGATRAVLYGYACHGTSIAGEDFYVVSGDYMTYAREHLEAVFPGIKAVYLTGYGADINPSPRGRLIHAKQHGLELAGAVAGVLNRPLRPVEGPIRRAYARIDLPLADSPTREKLVADSKSKDRYIRKRAEKWLAMLDSEKGLPKSVGCPMELVRIGDDLTFFFLAGEVVVDYAIRMKREFASDNPWMVGYAFEVPCYIPTMRILKEGGYEADSSLIYYGIYGPLLGRTEDMVLAKFREMVQSVRK
jgi:hypothetical protein